MLAKTFVRVHFLEVQLLVLKAESVSLGLFKLFFLSFEGCIVFSLSVA